MTTSAVKDLSQPNSPEMYLGGVDNDARVLRANAAFTASYVASSELNIAQCRSILLLIILNGTGISDSQMKVQFSDGASIYFDMVHLDIVAAANPVVQITELEMGGATANLAISIPNPGGGYMRVLVKANTTSGSIAIFACRGQGGGSFPMVNGS